MTALPIPMPIDKVHEPGHVAEVDRGVLELEVPS